MNRDSPITPDARVHLRLLLRSIRPLAARLERQFRSVLRERPYDSLQIRALKFNIPLPGALTAFGSRLAHRPQRGRW